MIRSFDVLSMDEVIRECSVPNWNGYMKKPELESISPQAADAFREVVDKIIQQKNEGELPWDSRNHRSYVCLDLRGDTNILYKFSYNDGSEWRWVLADGEKRWVGYRRYILHPESHDQDLELERSILKNHTSTQSSTVDISSDGYTADDSIEYFLKIRDDLERQ